MSHPPPPPPSPPWPKKALLQQLTIRVLITRATTTRSFLHHNGGSGSQWWKTIFYIQIIYNIDFYKLTSAVFSRLEQESIPTPPPVGGWNDGMERAGRCVCSMCNNYRGLTAPNCLPFNIWGGGGERGRGGGILPWLHKCRLWCYYRSDHRIGTAGLSAL